jgi:hypothetical protein
MLSADLVFAFILLQLKRLPPCPYDLQESIQNADDAGARDAFFCLDLRTHGTSSLFDKRLAQFQGPALLAYNSGVFTPTDFESIQRIGDSLKKVLLSLQPQLTPQ